MKMLLAVGVAVLAMAVEGEAKRYVGTGALGSTVTIARVRWKPLACTTMTPCWTLRAKYRCRGEVCPSPRPGKLLAEMRHAGDFGGVLTFGDGAMCTVAGSLTNRGLGGGLWETDLPKRAPRMTFALECGSADGDHYGFIGETPAP